MAKILIVHGISNQYSGEMELRSAWHPALCDGLSRAGFAPLPEADECFCPFYGDIFRPAGHLSRAGFPSEDDLTDAQQDEVALLEAIWNAAATSESQVPSPQSFDDTLFRAPKIAERALTALAKSRYLTSYLPLQFFGDLKQVVQYLNNSAIRRKVLDRVLARIEPDTTLVVGHSLGSVVAYEAICAKPENVGAFLTLGSPLGLRAVIFDKLNPPPNGFGLGRWPGNVKQWTNIAARGDIVAAQKKLLPLFGEPLADVVIDSGWDAHSSTRYLNTLQAGFAVSTGLKLSI